ncbi:hypothetical protein TNCV_4299091 [Trichonephila clavipes]|nr:hypothetical protein TNCV_4299091 [Trichonephila clavipes]
MSVTATKLFQNLYNATEISISQITVTQRLNSVGLYAKRPVDCIPVTANHKERSSCMLPETPVWYRNNSWRVLFDDES